MKIYTDNMSESNQHIISKLPASHLLHSIDASLKYLNEEKLAGFVESVESPIFIFAAGWRSGSTLLQRLINSDQRVALFGEAYEHFFLWQQFANQIKNFGEIESKHSCYVPENYVKILPHELDEFLTKAFTATLAPPVSAFKKAHLAFFDALMKKPIENVGRSIWGLKLVRSDIEVAKYFQWLYPKARFIFLVRNPYHAGNSCLNIISRIKDAFPIILRETYITNAYDYAHHWKHCVSSFLAEKDSLNAMFIKYEDLKNEKTVNEIEGFLNIKVRKNVLKRVVGATKKKEGLSKKDRDIITEVAQQQILTLGYQS